MKPWELRSKLMKLRHLQHMTFELSKTGMTLRKFQNAVYYVNFIGVRHYQIFHHGDLVAVRYVSRHKY